MSDINTASDRQSGVNRRDMLKATGTVAAASALAGVAIPQHVYAADNNTIQIALIGCGGRGTGAASDAMNSKNGPVKLVAMADVFEDKLNNSFNSLKTRFADKMDVPTDRRFIGFDSYKPAIDALKPGDIAIFTTPVAFRWIHFTYAIQKGINVFMEKPITLDGPTSRRMLALGEESVQKNLKVGVGLMCRHCDARGELYKRIKDGQMGDITLLRAYRAAGLTGSAFATKKPENMKELEFQIRNFHAFLWLSGGAFSDFLIHNIDECCWMKDAWPVEAKGFGGRHYRADHVDQNFDSYTTEYTFADGTKLMLEGRCMPGCHHEFASYAHGTKGSAIISQSGHAPSKARMFKNHVMTKDNISWAWDKPEPSPYQLEWDHLLDSIRNDKPHNEVKRGAQASLVTAMGRMACHTGQVVTYEQMLNHEHDLGASSDRLTMDGPSPLVADAMGKYPIPMPGIVKGREF